MELSCIRQNALPHTTKLFIDFLYHPDRVARFYPNLPVTGATLRSLASAIDFPADRRRELIDALGVQNSGNPLLKELSKPGAVAVVTGQQVGLFSGPLFAIYKALTAIKLAERLVSEGITAVPIFWLATEDHDLNEINHTWVFDRSHKPVLLQAGGTRQPNEPVGNVPIEGVPLNELHAALRGLPYADEAFEAAREAYEPGRTYGQAFSRLLAQLLQGLPILQVDPMLPKFRALAAPVLSQAVTRSAELNASLLERNRQLTDAEYHAQVHVEEESSLVFLLENGQRITLKRRNGDYLAGSRRIRACELAERAHELSPNALLRPVVQDSMMPTVAYCGGPAEIAYFAQSEVLYRKLLGRQPAAVPRTSFTILSARDRRRADRYDLELTDFFASNQALRDKVGRKLIDARIGGRVHEARAAAIASLSQMSDAVERFNPSIAKSIEKSRRKIEYQFQRIEGRVGREALEREAKGQDDLTELCNVIFPGRHLQERVYSTLAFVGQYGPDFAMRVYDALALECPDHRILTF